MQFYEENWLSNGFESAEEEAKYRAYGRELLARFREIHSANFQMPLAVERMFYIDVEGVKLRGYIDRVDKLDSGGLSIIDYKTSKELFTVDDLEQDLQLTIYQLAAEKIWQMPVEKLALYHFRSNTVCDCSPRSRTRLNQARQLVLDVAKNIADERFPATENEYCPCDFPEHCPYYRHKYMEALPETARQDMLPGLKAAEAVERYASLQSQMKELQIELDDIRKTIIDFCQGQGLNRVYGSEHAITYKLMGKAGFSEDAVKAILQAEGLWERATGLDQAKLKQLLADAGLAEDIRKKLEAMKQVISTYPQLRVKKLAEEE